MRLATSEASYLVASGIRSQRNSVDALLRASAGTLSDIFGGFLIVEISEGEFTDLSDPAKGDTIPCAFRVVASRDPKLDQLVEEFEQELGRIIVRNRRSIILTTRGKRVNPRGLAELPTDVQGNGSDADRPLVVGVEINPIHRNPETREIYPDVLRVLERQLTRAMRRVFHTFALRHTSHCPRHYHGLGRRAVVKAVWEVDRKLDRVGANFDFIFQVTPINPEKVWRKFSRQGCTKPPVFKYRPLTFDISLLKRELYSIPLERLEDPALFRLFAEKQTELDRMMTMLSDMGTSRFVHGSLQLYGDLQSSQIEMALRILESLPHHSRDESRGGYTRVDEFSRLARRELDNYGRLVPEMVNKFEVRNDVTGLMVSRGVLLIGSEMQIPSSRAQALLQHEIGTHMVTFYNGKAQPFQQLRAGLSGYEPLQEGLAVFAEYLVGGLSRPRLRLLAARVVASKLMVDGATFMDTFNELAREHGFARRTAFMIAMRIYRGGGLTKDASYLKGLTDLLGFLKNGGKIDSLFVGKIAAEHVGVIDELRWRGVLRPPPLRPRYLDMEGATQRLEIASKGVTPAELLSVRI